MIYYSEAFKLIYLSYYAHPYMFLGYLASVVLLFSFSEFYLLKRYFGYLYLSSSLHLYIAFLSFIIFAAGTYLQSASVQMAGAVLTFLVAVGYLGGKGASLLSLPSLVFILLTVSSVPEIELTLLFLTVSGLIGYFSFKVKREDTRDCEFCPQYREDGRNFCLYCGRLLNQIPFLIPSKKAVVLLFTMLLLLGSFQINIYVYGQENGYPIVKEMNLGYTKTLDPIPSLPGISISSPHVVNNGIGNVYVYNLTYGNILTQKAYFALAKTQGMAQSQLLVLSAAKPISSKQPQSSYSQYSWNVSNTPYLGYMVSYPVRVTNGQNVTNEFAAVLVGEDAQTFVQEDGTSLRTIVSSLDTFSSSQRSAGLLVDMYSTIIVKWSGIIEAVIMIALMLVFTSYVRTLDLRNKRVFDGILGLDIKEFRLLSLLLERSKSVSGTELMQKVKRYANETSWQQLVVFIERLKWLNIAEEKVSVIQGEPRLVWRFKL
jgi:hypothetical protein